MRLSIRMCLYTCVNQYSLLTSQFTRTSLKHVDMIKRFYYSILLRFCKNATIEYSSESVFVCVCASVCACVCVFMCVVAR